MSKYRPADISTLAANTQSVLMTTCQAFKDLEGDNKGKATEFNKAMNECTELNGLASHVTSRFLSAIDLLEQLRSSLSSMASSGLACNAASSAVNFGVSGSKSLRSLQETRVDLPENEPYYTMTYSALTKILLDYQLQEAAFQFCKFYEFRNGGVPPTVCGANSATTRTYYMLDQILAMRSYNAPTYNSVTTRVFLPTKLQVSSVYNRTYPYVDLAQLRAGESVYFTLPMWDIDWLKKYGWIATNVAANKVPSTYLESMIIYLPVEANASAGNPLASSITAAVHVESTRKQSLALTSGSRQYQLPSQTFTSGATYGSSGCVDANAAVNPYDVTAGCVQDGALSDVCLRERGTTETQNQKQLLPGLFSTWRITADFSQAPGGALDMIVPKPFVNSTPNEPVGELVLIADLTVVQVTPAKVSTAAVGENKESTVKTAAVAGTCCAVDEFRVARNECQKCAPGTTGALNGYACVPV